MGQTVNPRQIIVRRGYSAEWLDHDPVLGNLEPAYAIDTDVLKLGDGKRRWSELPAYTRVSDIDDEDRERWYVIAPTLDAFNRYVFSDDAHPDRDYRPILGAERARGVNMTVGQVVWLPDWSEGKTAEEINEMRKQVTVAMRRTA